MKNVRRLLIALRKKFSDSLEDLDICEALDDLVKELDNSTIAETAAKAGAEASVPAIASPSSDAPTA